MIYSRCKSLAWVRPGLWWLRTRQFFKGGVWAVWHREVTRRQILASRPVHTATFAASEIHVLTGRADWLNMMWALKSFYAYCHGEYALCIHDDGSLQYDHCVTLQAHFPDARIIKREQADCEMRNYLVAYPAAERFRNTNYLAQKVFDFEFYLRCENMLLLDSDVLFFGPPRELEARCKPRSYALNTLNRNSGFGYAMSVNDIRSWFALDLSGDINSGLGVLQKGALNIAWIDEWLKCEELRAGHPHRVEQTLIAMCCVKCGFEFLPAPYDVYNGPTDWDKPVRHYYGPVRPLMYSEGILRLQPDLITNNKTTYT